MVILANALLSWGELDRWADGCMRLSPPFCFETDATMITARLADLHRKLLANDLKYECNTDNMM